MEVFSLEGKLKLEGAENIKNQLSEVETRAQKVQKGLKVLGAAFTAVGVAGLAMIQSTKKINAQLGVTAINLDVTTKEMRALTLATTNVTFPIDEVTASFDLLARAGVKDTEVLKSTATAFDTLGDAIGQSASGVTQVMVPAMKTFRLSAEEIASKIDMMTYMTRNSTTSLQDFNTMVGYTSQDMVDAGLTIDDMAAAMMYMSDNGVEPGKVMLREWNKAVTLAEKEGIALTKALGMTSAELEIYKGKLAGATGLCQDLADIQNKQYTIMDKVKAKFEEITLSMSGFLEPLEPVLAGMTAMGPLMIFLSTSAGIAAGKWALHTTALIAHRVALIASTLAIKAITAAQWLWNIAMMANPIGLIIVGLAALIAIGVLLWKNWEVISAKAFEIWGGIVSFFEGIPERIGKAFSTLKDIMLAPFRAVWAGIGAGINWLIEQLNKIQIDIPSWMPGVGGKRLGINLPPVTLPEFKTGGIFTQPVAGIIGDVPEVVAPLSKLGGMGGRTVIVNVGGSVVTERDLVSMIRDALLETQSSNVSLGFA